MQFDSMADGHTQSFFAEQRLYRNQRHGNDLFFGAELLAECAIEVDLHILLVSRCKAFSMG